VHNLKWAKYTWVRKINPFHNKVNFKKINGLIHPKKSNVKKNKSIHSRALGHSVAN
jgi:hypothetical protein